MTWHINMNQNSFMHGASGEVAAEGGFVPSPITLCGLKAQNETTLESVHTTKKGCQLI